MSTYFYILKVQQKKVKQNTTFMYYCSVFVCTITIHGTLFTMFRLMFIVMVYSRHIGIVKKDEQLK